MDFNQPQNTTDYSLVLGFIRDAISDLSTFLDGTADQNVPDVAKRYNSTINKFQKYSQLTGQWTNLGFHDVIDAHIANTGIHSGLPVGSIISYAGGNVPAGFLECQGQLLSKTEYATLYLYLGSLYGETSTHFYIPNVQERFILGQKVGSPLGAVGGTFNHVHTITPHIHPIDGHVHGMQHVHQTPDHYHIGGSHAHTVPGHYHDTQGSGATIQVNESGIHSHPIPAKSNSGDGADGRLGRAGSGGTVSNSSTGFTTTEVGHTHPHTAVVGSVGNRSSNINGDSGIAVTSAGDVATSTIVGGAGKTGVAIDQSTFATVGYTASNGGQSTNNSTAIDSGTANPPYIIFKCLIKFQ